MKYYIKTHMESYKLYLLSIFSSIFGIFVVLIFCVRAFYEFNMQPQVNLILSSLVAAIIGGAPIFQTNYLVAKNCGTKRVMIRTFCLHTITVLEYFVMMCILLYCLIGDFR